MAESARPMPSGPDAPAVSASRAGLAETDALAFTTDAESERALVEGLAGCRDAEVWPGSLRAAAAALGQGRRAGLVVVDVDGSPYPAGALHELASVCEVGTAVVALGSAGTARFAREILLAGVSDYLVKPVTAEAVAEAAARALGVSEGEAPGGRLVAFAGTGGSGATTLAAATALAASMRGHYVSVLDLDRTVSAASLMLDVEPATGLVELLSTVARASLNPEMVERMCAVRSDRIGVYGYPWSDVPPPPAPAWAVCELLVELQRRSHLVIVDGMDDPATRQTLLALADVRVVVTEPTRSGAVAAARMTARLGPLLGAGYPSVLVQNHTRAFRDAATATERLREAGVARAPGVVVPFEPALASLADRGFPRDRLPAALRDPLGALVDRISASGATDGAETGIETGEAGAVQPAGAGTRPRPAPARTRRRRAARTSATPTRAASLRAALRRLVPSRGRGLQPA